MGLCGVGESHAPDAFAAVLNPTTDTHLSATRIHNDGIMQGAALPSTPPVWVATAKVHKNGYTFAQKCEFLLSIYKK